MLRSLLLIVYLFAAASTSALAQTMGPAEFACLPGYMDWPVSLALFVDKPLVPACEMLQRKEFAEAEKAFQQEIDKRPDNLAAHLGLLQSRREHREEQLAKCRQEVQASPTIANHFRVGVLALYVYGVKQEEAGTKYLLRQDALSEKNKKEKEELAVLARSELRGVYNTSHDPAAGFTLAHAHWFIGGDSTPICEDMLRRIGGTASYQAYAFARKAGWRGEQPPIPHISGHDLRILAVAVSALRSAHSGRSHIMETRFVNGTQHIVDKGYQPMPPEQSRAIAFLQTWRERLKVAADAASS